MQLIDAEGKILADAWGYVPTDEPLTSSGPLIVDWVRFQADRSVLLGRNAPLGVRVPNTTNVTELKPDLDRIGLIALEFPKFTDGRAFSQARLLRDQLGYTGELRAVGQVFLDQLLFLRRVGFNSFELAQLATPEQIKRALGAFSVFYQSASDGSPVILRDRLRVRAAGGDR